MKNQERASTPSAPTDSPRLTVIYLDTCGSHRFRIVGEPTADNWKKERAERPDKEPWCEVSIWPKDVHAVDSELCDHLGSYGGELWPSAWPELFYHNKPTAQQGPVTYLTELAQELFARALAAKGEPVSPAPSSLPRGNTAARIPAAVNRRVSGKAVA